MSKKWIAVLLSVLMLLSGFAAFAEETHNTVVVLYTNDVHCGVDSDIGYAGLAAYKKAYEGKGCEVALVDCGDAIQGGPIGTLSKGEYITDIMNEVGYSVATIGNLEFDYGMDQFMALREKANFPYVAANFLDKDGNAVLDPYFMMEIGGWKIGFVGAITPETYTKSTPAYFKDEEGNFIYSFCEGNDGKDLYEAVQKAVDGARAEGEDFVVVLSHLGIEAGSVPYTSGNLIENTTGIDVVLDGHSHSVIESEMVKNANGDEVTLTSTGTKFANVGSLTIAPDGTLSTQLHSESLFQDAETADYIGGIEAQFEGVLSEVVATTQVALVTEDPATEQRIVRSAETNLGDLCADAYHYVLGADIGFVNGGGVRAPIAAGDVTYGNIIEVHPFCNMACLVEATGQQIIDALEMSVHKLPDENGGFLQVSGLTYEINMAVDSTVVTDDQGGFVEVTGDRRVQNVLVNGEPIDLEKTYTVATHNYMIKSGGDGMTMFMNNKLLKDEVMLDNEVLIQYITENLEGVVGEDYSDPYGQGRIVFVGTED